MPERRYSDEEVALILREASNLQEGGRPRGDEGLSLAQLKDIAAEVGLDPAGVEAAARSLGAQRAGAVRRFLGTPVAPEFEREVSGEVKPEAMADIVTAIRKALGRRGVVQTELGALEWSARDAMGGRYVSVLPKDGTTRLRVFGNFRDGLIAIGLGAGVPLAAVMSAILAALGLKELIGPGILPLGALLSVLPVRALWRWRYRREEEALERLAGALDAGIQELVAEPDAHDPRTSG